MGIKAVILDVKGTMLKRSFIWGPYSIVKGIPEMIEWLRTRNIAIFCASDNLSDAYAAQKRLHIDDDNILFAEKVGAKKGGKKFIEYICAQLALSPNELLYLGDQKHDYKEAVNSHVAFFLAAWSNCTLGYGIEVETPLRFTEVIETFFLKQTLWYYHVDDKDGLSRNVTVRSLLDPDIAKNRGITALLKSKGVGGTGTIKTFNSSDYISLHLFASVYLEGLHLSRDGRELMWCMYPGHAGHYTSVLTSFTEMISRQFQGQYIENLIQRHTTSIHSSYARPRGYAPNMDNQLRTIQLDPHARKKIAGRSIIVLDDFTTRAYCFETTRNFLFNAGATSVTCIAVGKYAKHYIARYPKRGVAWDSFAPTSLTENDFIASYMKATIDVAALTSF